MKALTLAIVGSLVFGHAIVHAAAPPGAAMPENSEWIWSPAHTKTKVPAVSCYFRKTFDVDVVEEAQVEITADDAYELYVNGRKVGSGENWKVLDIYNISRDMVKGRNTIAIKATNNEGGTAAVVARVLVKQQGGTQVAYSTDATWKTSLKEFRHWSTFRLDDSQWVSAQSFGALGAALPWGNETQVAGPRGRFQIVPRFRVEWVIQPKETGSLVAMTFNEFGQIIASRENGPLLLISDKNKDGAYETVRTYCQEVKNCQGLLALNGALLVIGDGPDGTALYRLTDSNLDGQIDQVKTLLRFTGPMREHGPHALTLGPDGMLYIVVGNHSMIDREAADSSPFQNYYDGDLIQPRYEDPGGHAVGIKAPGGTIVRTDTDGVFVELFAGGLRNPYDIGFNNQGDLFTYDADMESDIGLPWYRPTRINHLTPGAELGWRSGWAKWPEYYLDSLPSTLNMGPGSPTGIVFYDHHKFPMRYQNVMFACDWSRGQIVVVRMERQNGSYTAQSSVFLQGRPLNATDVAVGPDGWLYFCTGGRDTEGGVYRVTWSGQVPPEVTDPGKGIEQALRQPQLDSAWARQQVAKLQLELADQWGPELTAIARSRQRTPDDRVRALHLMQLFGPLPTIRLLSDLSTDGDPEVRTKVAYLMGIYADEVSGVRLVQLLADPDATVRRQACESLVRARLHAPLPTLLNLLADGDRHVAFAARRALERIPPEEWRSAVLKDRRTRVFLNGSVALLAAYPDRTTAIAILNRTLQMMLGDVQDGNKPPGFINDRDFTDLLRVTELALSRGGVLGDDVPSLRAHLAKEYPSVDIIINRELSRLLVYLEEPTVAARIMEQLRGNIPEREKLHLAALAGLLKQGWTTEQKFEMLRFYEKVRTAKGGNSLAGYVDYASRDFFTNLTANERQQVLKGGAKWPSSALAVLAKLPPDPGEETLAELVELDRQLQQETGEAERRLRLGIVAILGRSRDPKAMQYLREMYDRDPNHRVAIAMGLAQAPDGENWALLVRSLPIIDGVAAREVLKNLATVDRAPDEPEPLRQAILCGLRAKDEAAPQAVALLEMWTGQKQGAPDDPPQAVLSAWQEWFAQTYPDQPEPQPPVDSEESRWTYKELLSYLESPSGLQGDAAHGEVIFERAQCFKCHRFGDRGESVGPDLTTISRRFQVKEILQAIVFPSHVISDQYASKTVMTQDGRTLSGIVTPHEQESLAVLQSNGEKVTIKQEDVDEIMPSKVSAMPEGLLNTLTLNEIADLFAYLTDQPRANISSRRGETKR